jgi:DNA-binding NarL/FixJ family response regulator
MTAFERVVVVVEDELFIQSMLADGLKKNGFKVETASNVLEARRVIDRVQPDAVLLDIDLGAGANGLDLGESLLAQSPDIAVVYLTVLSDPRLSSGKARQANPRAAYLNKRSITSIELVIEALEAVLHDADVSQFRDDKNQTNAISKLSNSQLETLRLVARGFTNQQIADARKRSLSATEALISRTFESLGINPDENSNARIIATKAFLDGGGMVESDRT